MLGLSWDDIPQTCRLGFTWPGRRIRQRNATVKRLETTCRQAAKASDTSELNGQAMSPILFKPPHWRNIGHLRRRLSHQRTHPRQHRGAAGTHRKVEQMIVGLVAKKCLQPQCPHFDKCRNFSIERHFSVPPMPNCPRVIASASGSRGRTSARDLGPLRGAPCRGTRSLVAKVRSLPSARGPVLPSNSRRPRRTEGGWGSASGANGGLIVSGESPSATRQESNDTGRCLSGSRRLRQGSRGRVRRATPRPLLRTAPQMEAFDTACKELREVGRLQMIRKLVAQRIIVAARKGELDPIRLRTAALSGPLLIKMAPAA
jgi:hypothetical protein